MSSFRLVSMAVALDSEGVLELEPEGRKPVVAFDCPLAVLEYFLGAYAASPSRD